MDGKKKAPSGQGDKQSCGQVVVGRKERGQEGRTSKDGGEKRRGMHGGWRGQKCTDVAPPRGVEPRPKKPALLVCRSGNSCALLAFGASQP